MSEKFKERYAFLEHRIRWYKGVTASQLANVFGIKRENAQTVVSRYQKEHENEITYDQKLRRQVGLSEFTPSYIRNSSQSFLDHMRGQNLIDYYREGAQWDAIELEDADGITELKLSDDVMMEVVLAINEKRVLRIVYHSINQLSQRHVSPNQLVYAEHRYHLRAYCHNRKEYLDFVLSRIEEAEALPHPTVEEIESYSALEWVSSEDDRNWHQAIRLTYMLNPELGEDAKGAMRLDFILDSNDQINITIRTALRIYIVHRFDEVDSRFGKKRWVLINEVELNQNIRPRRKIKT